MRTKHGQNLLAAALFGVMTVAIALTSAKTVHAQQPDQAQAIAKEAFIYGFPIVDAYQTLYKQPLIKTALTSKPRSITSAT